MIDDDLKTIVQELRSISESKFTGKVALSLDMSQGGIGKMALNLERNLKKTAKKSVF